MMLSKETIRKMSSAWVVTACTLIVIAVVLVTADTGTAAGKPMTVTELALYKGADRQEILEEGAKKEGKLIFYTTGTQAKHIVKAFQKKYPYIKVEIWRASTNKLLPKVLEEHKVGRISSDVIGLTQAAEIVMEERGILQPFYSPELAYIEENAIKKTAGGDAFSAGHFQSGISLGYNTELIKKDQIPKTHRDLLDPKWKGKMPICGMMSGMHWMGGLLVTYGEDFVKQVAKQEFEVHMVSARALLDMIVAGEYVFSPAIYDSHVNLGKKKGAPVDWIPLAPVSSNLGQIVLPKHSLRPHAAMLYIDFDLSKQAGEIYKAQGYNSPRKDIITLRPYKKYYGFKSTEEVAKKTKLFNKLFLKK
ncbi:ABC transporter substrate-binding protein [Thermodesulfobacteriota bacterium]